MAQILVGLIGDAEDTNVQALITSILKAAAGKDVKIASIGGGDPETPAPDAETPPAAARKPKDFVVFRKDGEKRAGYAIAEDAAQVLIHDLLELTTSTDVEAFGRANIKTLARFPKALQKSTQDKIIEHCNAVRAPAADPTVPVADASAATVPEAGAGSAGTTAEAGPSSPDGSGQTATSTASLSEEATLAAAFGFTAPDKVEAAVTQAIVAKMEKGEFFKEMASLAQQMGAVAGKAWMDGLGYTITSIPEDKYAEVVANGKNHLANLKK